MKPRRYDRVCLGTGNPKDRNIYECYDAPWYRLDRWIKYLLNRAPGGYVLIDGRRIRVRVRYAA